MIDVMIIAHNEALNLPYCLRSLQGWTRKVFVIDSGSTDGTPDVARSFGAEVFEHTWEGYARQKNWGLENLPIEADWLLIVDADESIPDALRRQFEAIASRPVDEVAENGFFVNRLTYFLGQPIRHCGYFPSWNMRFIKPDRGRYEDREVHEHVIIDDPVGYIKEPMLHNDRRGLEHYMAKHNRYSTLEARSIWRELSSGRDTVEAVNVDKKTRQRRWLKRRVLPKLPMPELWRFLYMYFIQLGVLDGRIGFEFCRFISAYDYLLALKLRAIKRAARSADLDEELIAQPCDALAAPEGRVTVQASAAEPGVDTDALSPEQRAALSHKTFLKDRLVNLVEPDTRVVITGGSGFIGTNLVELYRAGGSEVINIDCERPRDPAQREGWEPIDILDHDKVTRTFRDFDPHYVFHLAARTDLDGQTLDDYQANIAGTANVLTATEGLASIRRIVVTSTQLVFEPGQQPAGDEDYSPPNPYGASKVETERITRQWENPPCPWVIVRPTSIWGPWFDIPYRDFFMAVAKRRYMHQRGVDPLRSFGFVGNICHQFASYATADPSRIGGKTYFMSDYDPVRVRDWANMIQREMGVAPLRTVGVPTLRVAAKMGDAARTLGWKEPPITSSRLAHLLADNYHDMSAVTDTLGDDSPFAIHEGVVITVQWLQDAGLVK